MRCPPGTDRRILVIDESRVSRSLVREHLQEESVVIVEAENGRDGMALASRERLDLILMDLSMPIGDGFETIRQLKDDPRTRAIPVIFLSAESASAAKAKGLDLGAVDFISRPFDPVELKARVRAALRTKSLQDALEEQAHLDGLTGLGNRLALEERLLADWNLCNRRDTPISLLIADLDRFKAVNDQHGHAAGDAILQQIASVLRDSVRDGDFVARYGGEEFVVVAPDCDLGGAISMGERFRSAVGAMRTPTKSGHIVITTSVGVCSCRPMESSPGELLGHADSALYQAKSAGRDSVWVNDRGIIRASSPSRHGDGA
ncbi:MAG: diguanylate cyclase protein [Planctomycetota bacterium]|nr:diguanylate cyclase protein [Planctomycetota bacterium]